MNEMPSEGTLEKKVPQTEAIESHSDLNTMALAEFQRMVEVDVTLPAQWRETILSMVASGPPRDISALEALILGGGSK